MKFKFLAVLQAFFWLSNVGVFGDWLHLLVFISLLESCGVVCAVCCSSSLPLFIWQASKWGLVCLVRLKIRKNKIFWYSLQSIDKRLIQYITVSPALYLIHSFRPIPGLSCLPTYLPFFQSHCSCSLDWHGDISHDPELIEKDESVAELGFAQAKSPGDCVQNKLCSCSEKWVHICYSSSVLLPLFLEIHDRHIRFCCFSLISFFLTMYALMLLCLLISLVLFFFYSAYEESKEMREE